MQTSQDPSTRQAQSKQPRKDVGCNSLLLLLLQLMVSALLVLQQDSGVLQVTGQAVAFPLQLLGCHLGPFVSTLQFPEL